MAFSFSFAGDDINTDLDQEDPPVPSADTFFIGASSELNACNSQAAETGSLRKHDGGTAFPIEGQTLLPSTSHSLSELIATLPGTVAYGTLEIVLRGEQGEGCSRVSGGGGSKAGKGEAEEEIVGLRRRELWDVRMQIMAEDGMGVGGTEGRVVGLGQDDVKTGVYEGGFKSWECSVDLVRVLSAERGEKRPRRDMRVLEMGCGTALPSLALLQWYLSDYFTQSPASKIASRAIEQSSRSQNAQPKLHLTLSDYNPSVLSLVTLPNIILTWAQCRVASLRPSTATPRNPSASVPQLTSSKPRDVYPEATHDQDRDESTVQGEGELELTPELLNQFQQDMVAANVKLDFVSGAWSPEFVNLVSSTPVISQPPHLPTSENGERETSETTPAPAAESRDAELLVIAAETIYSPFALHSFTEALMSILERNQPEMNVGKGKSTTRALIGAKKVYFGVGGSLEDFVEEVRKGEGISRQIREEEDGVRRAVVEITLPEQ